MGYEDRIRSNIERKERTRQIIAEKLELLEQQAKRETRDDEKFRLKHLIDESQADLAKIDKELRELEAQLGPSASRQPEGPINASVVYLDLARYSAISRSLEIGHRMGAEATQFLNNQIKQLIRQAASDAGIDFETAYVKSTGDGAILCFDTPAAADTFAVALLRQADQTHNQDASAETEYRCFRIGIFSGTVIREAGDIAGATVGFAARLESQARTGEILMDAASWAQLPAAQQQAYGVEEVVSGKAHDQPFSVHRRKVCEPAPWDVSSDKPGVSASASSSGPVNKRALRITMDNAFSLADLQLLCADLQEILKDKGKNIPISLEHVGGDGKLNKIQNLIDTLERHRCLDELLDAVRQARPGINIEN